MHHEWGSTFNVLYFRVYMQEDIPTFLHLNAFAPPGHAAACPYQWHWLVLAAWRDRLPSHGRDTAVRRVEPCLVTKHHGRIP